MAPEGSLRNETACKSLGESCDFEEVCCPSAVCRFLGSERGYFCTSDFTTSKNNHGDDDDGIFVVIGIIVMTLIFLGFFTSIIVWCTKKCREIDESRSAESVPENRVPSSQADDILSRPMERALDRIITRQTNVSVDRQEPRRQRNRPDGQRSDPPPNYTDVANDSPELPSYNEAVANESRIT